MSSFRSMDFDDFPSFSASSEQDQCDVCYETAVKRCLTCMVSYCGTHVKEHYSSPDLERHQLQNLQHMDLCEEHHRQLEFYCRTDQSAICTHCLLHNHKTHDVIEQNPQGTQSFNKTGVPPPGPIQFTTLNPDSVTVSWSPPQGTDRPQKYRVTRRRGQEQRNIIVAGLSLKVTDLILGETYHFTVATLNEDGHQSTCVKKSLNTEVPPPENLTVEVQSLTASLKWSKPAGVDQVSYLLELYRDQIQIDTIHRDSLHYTITDLLHGADYTIKVYTVVTNGNQSQPQTYTFKIEIPVPQNLILRNITSSSANVIWNIPSEMNQTPHSFLVSYQSDGAYQPQTISTKSCSAVIQDLKPSTNYVISVYTQVQNRTKSEPAVVLMKTEIDPTIPMIIVFVVIAIFVALFIVR